MPKMRGIHIVFRSPARWVQSLSANARNLCAVHLNLFYPRLKDCGNYCESLFICPVSTQHLWLCLLTSQHLLFILGVGGWTYSYTERNVNICNDRWWMCMGLGVPLFVSWLSIWAPASPQGTLGVELCTAVKMLSLFLSVFMSSFSLSLIFLSLFYFPLSLAVSKMVKLCLYQQTDEAPTPLFKEEGK